MFEAFNSPLLRTSREAESTKDEELLYLPWLKSHWFIQD